MDLFTESRTLDAERHEIGDRFTATLNPEQHALYLKLEAADSTYWVHEQRILISELCRHLPFLATAITVIAEHISDDGAISRHTDERALCCVDGGSA